MIHYCSWYFVCLDQNGITSPTLIIGQCPSGSEQIMWSQLAKVLLVGLYTYYYFVDIVRNMEYNIPWIWPTYIQWTSNHSKRINNYLLLSDQGVWCIISRDQGLDTRLPCWFKPCQHHVKSQEGIGLCCSKYRDWRPLSVTEFACIISSNLWDLACPIKSVESINYLSARLYPYHLNIFFMTHWNYKDD